MNAHAKSALNESPDIVVAKVVSDLAGKKVLMGCGPVKEGVYMGSDTQKCVTTVTEITQKLAEPIADCEAKLLSKQACEIIEDTIKRVTSIAPPRLGESI